MTKKGKKLHFRISAGLKNVIGRELISDKYIAIFEIVKNSYDAGATHVIITYKRNDNHEYTITIQDDGVGMNYDDITNKWFFVAYSGKKEKNRSESYVDKMTRHFAGAKGIGRFSCDRLGSELKLFSKKKNDLETHVVDVDWNKFEVNDKNEFVNIPVLYHTEKESILPKKHGTILLVSNLREEWSRNELLSLKRYLMKLISPDFNNADNNFAIKIVAPDEEEEDKKVQSDPNKNIWRDTVNGFIKNDILEQIDIKTTNITVDIDDDGKRIFTKLSDRGVDIFSLMERNRDYTELKNIHVSIFYLNGVAKAAFTRQMGGVQPKNYGSIFVYKNGFRVSPYGEPNQDFFGIDLRKTQGYKRHLGSRELMGRISIIGNDSDFMETSSRAHGFIRTPAVEKLEEFFIKKVLSVLEKYVVNLIAWGEPLKNQNGHVISPEEINAQIISQFITNINPKDVEEIKYNKDLLSKNNEQSKNLYEIVDRLEKYARKSENEDFRMLAKKTKTILQVNEELEQENVAKSQELDRLKKENEVQAKQVFFLENASDQNVENLLNGMHSVYTLADANKGNISDCMELLRKENISEEAYDILIDIYQANAKIHKIADLAFHGNSLLENQTIGNVFDFVKQYTEKMNYSRILINLKRNDNLKDCRFSSSALSIIIDNIISNSQKNEASKIDIVFSQEKKYILISFIDNGLGLDSKLNPTDIFKRGFSANSQKKGFGMGLPQIHDLVKEMNGSVAIDLEYKKGFKLDIRLKNEYSI